MAISGLHLTLIAGSAYMFLILFGLPQRLCAVLAMGIIAVYVFISGAAVSIQRAGIMAATVFLAMALNRGHHFLNLFFLAFFALLWKDPKNLNNLAFQLSFLSVFSLIFLIPRPLEHWRWKETLGRSLAILIGTLPVILFYFNIFSPISLIANFLAIPLVHMSLLASLGTLALGDLPVLGGLLIALSQFLIKTVLSWILFLSGCKWGFYYFRSPGMTAIFIYYIFLGLWWLSKRIQKRGWRHLRPLFCTFWFAALLGLFHPGTTKAEFRMTLFSAGKNEIAHIQWGLKSKEHWLVNAGRSYPSDQGRWLLVPYLRHEGINRLKGIILTDFYKRHYGGLSSVLFNLKTNAVFYPAHLSLPADLEGYAGRTQLIPVEIGASIRENNQSSMQILGFAEKKPVLFIRHKDWKILMIPYLRREVEDVIKRNAELLRNLNVLILPSSRSGNEQRNIEVVISLMEWIDPDLAVAASSFPGMEDVFLDFDIPLFDAEKEGAVFLSVIPMTATSKSPDADTILNLHSLLGGMRLSLGEFLY